MASPPTRSLRSECQKGSKRLAAVSSRATRQGRQIGLLRGVPPGSAPLGEWPDRNRTIASGLGSRDRAREYPANGHVSWLADRVCASRCANGDARQSELAAWGGVSDPGRPANR